MKEISEEHSKKNTKLGKYKYIYYKNTHTYTNPHITKQVKITTLNNLSNYMAQSISESYSAGQKFLRIVEIPFTQEPATDPCSETHYTVIFYLYVECGQLNWLPGPQFGKQLRQRPISLFIKQNVR